MPGFNHAEELVNVFSKYIFDQASVDYKQQIVINALDKITKDKKRIIGFLRFQTIKEKLTQCISQSYEIKTGYILEDFFEKLFGFHFHNLSKIVNGYKCDQLFEDDNYIYLIEQKIRDDHDTSKRGGQVENFIQKIAALEEKCIQKNKKLKAYMWFVDDNFKKNKSFYAEKLSHIGNENTEEVSLYYGRTIVDYLLGNQEIWDNFVTSFIATKTAYTSDISRVINEYDFDNDPDGFVFNNLKKKQTKTLIELFYSNDYAEVRQSLFSNNLMMNKIKEYFIAHLTPARRTFINRGQENN